MEWGEEVPKEIEREINGNIYYSMLNTSLHRFCIGLYVRAGVVFEDEKENGITHLLEHMVFRNVKRKYGGRLYEMLNSHGLVFNACTYKEFVYFYIMGMPEGFDFAAEVICSVFDKITVTGEEFKTEKLRVKSEIREDAEKTTLSYLCDCELWEATPQKNMITGTCGTVDSISRKRLNEYKDTVMSRGNFFFYITGNVDGRKMKTFEKHLGSLNVSDYGFYNSNIAPVPEHFCKRKPCVKTKGESFYHIKMCFDVDNSKCTAGARDIVYSSLFDGENAMMYIGLSEENPLIYSLDSSFEQYDNISVIKLDFEVSKRHLKDSILRVFGVLNKLKSGDFSFEDELRWKISTMIMIQDSADDFNWNMAYENHILSCEPIDFEKNQLGRYDGVTKEDVVNAANAIFVKENLTVAVMGDKDFLEKSDIAALYNLL